MSAGGPTAGRPRPRPSLRPSLDDFSEGRGGLAVAPRRPGYPGVPNSRGLLTLVLIGAFLWSVLQVEWGERLLQTGGIETLKRIAGSALHPALSGDILLTGLAASWQTLVYATTGVSLAIVMAIPLGVFASGVLARRRASRAASVIAFRGILAFLRAIHELVWAWLFLAAIGLSPLTAVFAIAFHYAGMLGRIFADMLNNVPEEPLRSLRSSGASEWQVLLYGRIAWALANLVSYALYRYECGIRAAAIMSFVGVTGLGYQIKISMHDLNYEEVWTFVYFLILLVVVFELVSRVVRRRLVA